MEAYQERFIKLSRYASYMVDTDEKNARRFARGLKNKYRKALAPLKLRSYEDVVESVRNIMSEAYDFQ